MKRFVYMNECIRQAVPSRPVIVVQTGRKLEETNRAQLVVGGNVIGEIRFEAKGLKQAPKNHVRAFVELYDGVDVVVR